MSMGEGQLRVVIEDDEAGTAKSIDREIAESKRDRSQGDSDWQPLDNDNEFVPLRFEGFELDPK